VRKTRRHAADQYLRQPNAPPPQPVNQRRVEWRVTCARSPAHTLALAHRLLRKRAGMMRLARFSDAVRGESVGSPSGGSSTSECLGEAHAPHSPARAACAARSPSVSPVRARGHGVIAPEAPPCATLRATAGAELDSLLQSARQEHALAAEQGWGRPVTAPAQPRQLAEVSACEPPASLLQEARAASDGLRAALSRPSPRMSPGSAPLGWSGEGPPTPRSSVSASASAPVLQRYRERLEAAAVRAAAAASPVAVRPAPRPLAELAEAPLVRAGSYVAALAEAEARQRREQVRRAAVAKGEAAQRERARRAAEEAAVRRAAQQAAQQAVAALAKEQRLAAAAYRAAMEERDGAQLQQRAARGDGETRRGRDAPHTAPHPTPTSPLALFGAWSAEEAALEASLRAMPRHAQGTAAWPSQRSVDEAALVDSLRALDARLSQQGGARAHPEPHRVAPAPTPQHSAAAPTPAAAPPPPLPPPPAPAAPPLLRCAPGRAAEQGRITVCNAALADQLLSL